ncbi:hypothetical protein [Candidatus Phytoplasma luffae]|uniref:hypothetical protein n=1 Tax=Loofah witches'-broom phytoplasma TaxID=35773 RepID=UPI001FECD01A|nr:hypothetical protein [Candidatus Phytoplasma luffae]
MFELTTQTQGESSYPYLFFCDNANQVNPLDLKIKFSNLCTEILQPTFVSNEVFLYNNVNPLILL